MTATPDTAALQALLAKVEAGELPPSKLIVDAFGVRRLPNGWDVIALIKWIMGDSIEAMGAAKALMEAVLPGYKWGRQWSEHMWVEIADIPGRSDRYYGQNSDPARAWLMAILRALPAAPVTPEKEGE